MSSKKSGSPGHPAEADAAGGKSVEDHAASEAELGQEQSKAGKTDRRLPPPSPKPKKP